MRAKKGQGKLGRASMSNENCEKPRRVLKNFKEEMRNIESQRDLASDIENEEELALRIKSNQKEA